MSQSPTEETNSPSEGYLDAWQDLAVRIRHGNSFSGREPNSVFLNTRGTRFADVSMMSGLGLPDDARGLAVTDWDGDGDLDVWVSNRTAPRLRLLRNDYATENGKSSLQLRLEGDPAKRCPRDAIGAVVTVGLKDADGERRVVRQVTAGTGFLSQSSKSVHIGLGDSATVTSINVRWPGARQAGQESFVPVAAGAWRLRQGTGRAQEAPRLSNKGALLAADTFTEPDAESEALVRLTEPRKVSAVAYRTWTGAAEQINPREPTLLLLWASWCQPCLKELSHLFANREAVHEAGMRMIAINIEEAQAALEDGAAPSVDVLQRALRKTGWILPSGRGDAALLEELDQARRAVLYPQEAMPLPSSFLLHDGRLVSFSQGAISVPDIVEEARRLTRSEPSGRPDHAVPFPGRWSNAHFVTHPVAIAKVYLEGGYPVDAREYLEEALTDTGRASDPLTGKRQEADIEYMLGETYRLENQPPRVALPHYEKAVRLFPGHSSAAPAYARALAASKRTSEAVRVLQAFVARYPKRLDIINQLGDTLQGAGKDQLAVAQYQAVLKAQPDDFSAMNQLCWVYATSADGQVRNPKLAVQLAQGIMSRYGKQAHALDSAAAAFAAAGQFDRAVLLGRRALAMAQQQRNARLLNELKARVALYEKGKPFVRPGSS